MAASCPGQRPALGGLSCGGRRGSAAHTLEAARANGLPGSVPRGELPPARRGTSRAALPSLPRVPRERRVPRAARLRRVRREDTGLVASCPASGRRWADYRAGGAAQTLEAARVSCVRDFLAPFPGVQLPPALPGRSRAACSWSSRPRKPVLPAGCAPEGSGRGRGSAAASRPLSRRSDWRTRRSVPGEYPGRGSSSGLFDDARPARRGVEVVCDRRLASRLPVFGRVRRASARTIGVYDRYRFVVTSRRIVYDGCIVRVVLLVHVRYVALLVNVGSVSMMISPVHLARVEMRSVPCSVCRDRLWLRE